MNNVSEFKDRSICIGWIAGLLIAIALLWIFTQPLQARYLMRSVNKVFVSSGQTYYLVEPVTKIKGGQGILGYWYSMAGTDNLMFTFAVFQDGILVPLGAIVSDNGKVDEIIPLSTHAIQVFKNLHQSILQIYINRIETAYLNNKEGRR
jgi:hypothetical protein